MIARPAKVHASNTRLGTILIVDDSAVARAVIGRMIDALPHVTVTAAVATVRAALDLLKTQQVDVILLDIDMPVVDGLTALPDLIAAGRGAKVLIVSSSCDDGGASAIQALALGAADTLVKPGAGSNFSGRFAQVLADKLTRLIESERRFTVAAALPPNRAITDQFDMVAIGASTGGIHALSQVLREIPVAFTTPIIITQHLPGSFMPYFAAQVAVLAGRPCDVATDRMRLRAGRVVIAPGDAHLRLASLGDGTAAVRLTHEPARSGCMPSVDPMFDSLAAVYGARALAIVLSGMGRDGSIGAQRIIDAGGAVVVQNRESSVVWGMPGTIASAGAASAILPPDEIGRLIASGRRPT